MRLITHIKALTEAASCMPEVKERKKKPRKQQPVNNLTQEKFEITTPERGSIAKRRSSKKETSDAGEDHKPLLLPDHRLSFELDEKQPVTSYFPETSEPKESFSIPLPQSLSRSLTTRAPKTLKRKQSLGDGLIKRVKSIKVAPTKQKLQEWFDDTENDVRRYAIRSPALEHLPLQDSLNIDSSAQAMARHAAVMDHRRASSGFAIY